MEPPADKSDVRATLDQALADARPFTDARENAWRPFAPELLDDSGVAYATLRSATALPVPEALAAIDSIVGQIPTANLFGMKVRASALVLRDLLGMGWEVRTD